MSENPDDEAKNPGGQPTKYRPEYVEQLISYFDNPPYMVRERTVMAKGGEVVKIETPEALDFPTLAGFACHIGVHRETLLNWTKSHPDFAEAYSRAKDFQERFIVVNGLKSLIHPAFAIFTAKNVLGWRDKQPGEDQPAVVINNTDSKIELEDRVRQLKGLPK